MESKELTKTEELIKVVRSLECRIEALQKARAVILEEIDKLKCTPVKTKSD